MAREKVFRVVIDGEEYVSKAADDAGKGMDRFTGKKDGWIRSFVDLRAAFDTVVQVGRALAGVAMDSLAAFDEYSASMRRLEGTARITGAPLEMLSELAATAKREFGLSSVQANDYATAVNNLATKAGYAGSKQELLAAMLDLGAAKGLTAAESLVAFEQSILGIDEGTDKLFGKNPSGLWADFAEQIGKSPGKMSDLEKSLVLVYATMEAGGKVQGSYSEWLASSQGQTALLTNRLQDAKVAFGDVLSPIRAVVVEGMNTFLDSLGNGDRALAQMRNAMVLMARNGIGVLLSAWQTFGPAVTFVLKANVAGVMLMGDAIRSLVIVTQKGVGEIVDKIGWLVKKGGKVLEAFGIEMVSDWGDTMQEWGQTTSGAADEAWDTFRRESEDAWRNVTRDVVTATPVVNNQLASIGRTGAETGRQVAAGAAQAGGAIKQHLGPATADLIVLTEDAMKSLKITATETLAPRKAEEFAGAIGVLEGKLREAKEQAEGFAPAFAEGDAQARDLAGRVTGIAEAAIDLGQAFGVLDADTASLLTSVKNIGSSVGRLLAGDISGVAGLLGAVANMATMIGSRERERQQTLRKNTEALFRLTKEVSGLNLGITGESFAKGKNAIDTLLGSLVFTEGGIGPNGERVWGSWTGLSGESLAAALASQGLTIFDLQEMAKKLGIELDFKDTQGLLKSLQALQQAFAFVKPGLVGSAFEDQLEFFKQTQGISGQTGTAAGLQGLLDFLVTTGGVSALEGFDLSSPDARQRLFELFTSLNNGGVDASSLGRLTGSQFRDLLLELIGGIDALAEDDPSGSAPSTSPAPVEGGETVPTTGTPTPATTLADVFRDYGAKALPLFDEQVALQTRIAAATEATATNTGATVDMLTKLYEVIADGGLARSVDRDLGVLVRELQTFRGDGVG